MNFLYYPKCFVTGREVCYILIMRSLSLEMNKVLLIPEETIPS